MNQLAENRLPGALVIPALGILLGLAPRTPPALALPPAVRDWKDGGSRPSGEPSPQGGSRRWGTERSPASPAVFTS